MTEPMHRMTEIPAALCVWRPDLSLVDDDAYVLAGDPPPQGSDQPGPSAATPLQTTPAKA